MNITYLLGAGASANALPTVADFPEKMLELSAKLEKITFTSEDNPKTHNELNEYKDNFVKNLKKFADLSNEFTTPDTYAKYLYLNNNVRDLFSLKTTLSVFMTLSQVAIERENNNKSEFYLDNRYMPFLISILESKQSSLFLPSNINFLSWNYDIQFEIALSKIQNLDDIRRTQEWFEIYPFNSPQSIPKLVHLNGIAGLFGSKEKFDNNIFDRHTGNENLSLKSAFQDISFCFENRREIEYGINEAFTFAWENNKYATNAISNGVEIAKNTDILIIIGYSFPFFNRNIDRQIMDSLKKDVIIYYQDINSFKNNLKEQFNLSNTQIIRPLDGVKYFFIPHNI